MSIETIRKALSFNCKAKIFGFGIILGCLGGLIWQELFSPLEIPPAEMNRDQEIQILKSDTNERLLTYIQGTWSSSIGDLIIEIDEASKSGTVTVIENADDNKNLRTKKYTVQNIETIDGFFGIVKLNICELNKTCPPEESLPLQINKVFGMDKTIIISFDKRLAYCIEYSGLCTRAFKRINN